MSIFNAFALMGGLAMFLFGMNVMGQALERRAGNSLKRILERLTSSPIKGVLLGSVVTAIIQSSTATTVMVVGFVNSGLMTLRQAISVIMGANIGTTMTSWILSLAGLRGESFVIQLLKPSSFSPVLAFVGIIMLMAGKNEKRKDTGTILLGFAVLMFGMTTMTDAVAPLADVPAFVGILTLFSNPVLGVLAGAVMTAVIQSSSASVGILQALSATGAITFGTAIPILMGQNIGTCLTAIMSAAGANKNAKRAAMVHLYFNAIGTVIFLALFYAAKAIIGFTFVDGPVTTVGIAIIHSVFNILSTAVMLPFIGQLEKLACLTIRDDAQGETLVVLDERLIATPSIAISQARAVIAEMAQVSLVCMQSAMELLSDYDPKKADFVNACETQVDRYEDILGTFLVKVSARDLSLEDSHAVSKMLHTIGDFERISDHGAGLQKNAQELHEKGLAFSGAAQGELAVLSRAVGEILDLTVRAFEDEDTALASKVEPLEQVVDFLRAEMKNNHITRLRKGQCTIEQGFIFNDMLQNLGRCSDHCSNIAVTVIEIAMGSLDSHSYLQQVKSGEDAHFKQEFSHFMEKYALPPA